MHFMIVKIAYPLQDTSHHNATPKSPKVPKNWNSKIWFGPLASPAFWPCFLRPWAENQNSAPNIFFALLSQFQKGVRQPLCPKTPGGNRLGRKVRGLTPRAAESKTDRQTDRLFCALKFAGLKGPFLQFEG